ncbi:MAG: UDP-N-acetylmuramoyl-L-alanyl-D-glutamate--2,6-diaminopimelate ligase [Candidatus Hydrogenedentes bacterium]|nr:UDP-N-acetylmuramoyl-L-alanyl-D-glutamate--2,6-diaminopimelate ligase [Candidatus Hydrogenedentota bacterium]
MLELSYIVSKWNLIPQSKWENTNIIGVSENSKRIKENFIFVAIVGEHTDGYKYIPEALRKGAVAIVGGKVLPSEVRFEVDRLKIPYFISREPRKFLSELAHILAGDPTKDMVVIGITGTNGKTTVTYMIENILKERQVKVGRFGTLGYQLDDEYIEAVHTTPFAEDLVYLFSKAREKGISHVVMEVSSHSLAQDRVTGIRFNVCGFTNLTQDHLDYHKTMEDYLKAKLKLFELTAELNGCGVVNISDPYGRFFLEIPRLKFFTYGYGGDFHPTDVRLDKRGTTFVINSGFERCNVKMPLIGRYNVLNALCASAIAKVLGIEWEYIKRGLETLRKVPGRFEIIDESTDFTVVVDYAHTEDGLNKVLTTARELTEGRIITVFGCGGNRDKAKRPKMGYTAGIMSDFVIVTSDNPRNEDPMEIIAEIEKGVLSAGRNKGKDFFVIEDREEAIRFAVNFASKGDMVIIAGKGHEPYQIIGDKKIPFDDREVARKYLKERTCLGNIH